MQTAININPFISGMAAGLTPPPILSLSQWAEQYAYLSPESSAEPGKWSAYPYQVDIMDAFTDPLVEKITLMKSSRIGYTKIINHALAFHIDHDPAPVLIVQPTVEDAKGYSKDEIAPMLRDTPVLKNIVSEPRSRDSDNTILRKAFPGGSLTLIGANSARGFRRITVRVVCFDEVDAYPPSAGKEGDQLVLGERRTDTFWNRKIVIGSTPTIKGASRIETSFNDSDQRYLFVPCPFCRTFQVIRWKNIKWPKNEPHRAYLECVECKKEIPHSKKREMVSQGVWKTDLPFTGHVGFWIWAAYSFNPNASWGNLAKEFLEANRAWKNGEDPEKEKLKAFFNTRCAEVWEDSGERIDDEILISRREHFKDEAPEDVLVITMGIDVQTDRIECEIVGWGLGFESWSLDYVVLKGIDPRNLDDPAWVKLDKLLSRVFERPDLVSLHIAAAGIDTGFATDAVYAFVRPRQTRRLYAFKGSSVIGAPLVGKPTTKTIRKKALGLNLYSIGTDTAKDTISARLKVEKPGPGYCHFPDDRDENYFDMLTAEEAKTLYKKGVPYRKWQLKPKKSRNEALDCRVYAYAALHILNPQWKAIAEKQKKRAEVKKSEKEIEKSEGEVKKPVRRKKPRPRRKGFVQRW